MLLEMYEKNNLTEICLKDICSAADDNYNLRSQSDFRVPDIMQSFHYFMSLKNKIIVLIVIHWKIACEIITDTIGASPIEKL